MQTLPEAVQESIDAAYMCGQIDALSMLLVLGYDPTNTMMSLLLVPGGFEKRVEELKWAYLCWCFAQNCAMVVGRPVIV